MKKIVQTGRTGRTVYPTFTKKNIDETWLTRENEIVKIIAFYDDRDFPLYGEIDMKVDVWMSNGRTGEMNGIGDIIKRVDPIENPEYFI